MTPVSRRAALATLAGGAGAACMPAGLSRSRLADANAVSPSGLSWGHLRWGRGHERRRVMRAMRAQTAVDGIDPDRIGVMGFSAGGHGSGMRGLASSTARACPQLHLNWNASQGVYDSRRLAA